MELIKWSEKFATGIDSIDHEHAALIATINSFYSKITQHAEKSELINMLNNIYATIHAHFMLEERLMERYQYDQYRAHSDDHARLLDDIRDIVIELENTSDFNEQQLKEKLNDWFFMHFKTHDARLHKLEQLIINHKKTGSGIASWLKNLKKACYLQNDLLRLQSVQSEYKSGEFRSI